ncbi:MAG: hypothetical protein ACOYU4_00705 [Thermodesulfobacteriota bacterium]
MESFLYHRNKQGIFIKLILLSYALLMLCSCNPKEIQIIPPEGSPKSISDLKAINAGVTEYVSTIKGSFNKDSAEFKEARDKYIGFYSQYEGWVSAFKGAIVSNTNIAQSEEYKTLSSQVQKTGNDFIEFAKAKTESRTKTIAPEVARGIIVGLFEGGILIWKEHRKEVIEERMKFADYMGSELKLPKWDEIR